MNDNQTGLFRAPTITATIQRRILVNYRVAPEALAAVLPPPFRPAPVGGYGVAGICLMRLGGIRPARLPAAVGVTTEFAAHRVAASPPAAFLAVVRRALDDDGLSGVVHVTSPNPVRNADLMAAFRKARHRPAAPPTPAALVRMGAVVLRTDPALALTGRRCVPRRLLDAGFEFALPTVAEALADLFPRSG